ncbi:DUF2502 domain-containing protein [Serratia sp. AKBS12]|uniref:DUF2502 domain-containing protein n=1 Tax=Serratia sp. AKBS12 TaxID=2974597 RepID=UPI0021655DAB|nr:DUF2502 domain-containing protein [Serratia sp. AKBS12]MCS3408912.1 DUF2502 domain-containing protein [Serratia sp. AKBS12]
MNKILLLVCLPLLLPLAVQAEIAIDIKVPGASVHLGDRDHRGYYWDGYDWRPPQWWHDHQGRSFGERSARGYYWDGGRWQQSPPRGYGSRGNDWHHGNDQRHDDHHHRSQRDDHNRGAGDNHDSYRQARGEGNGHDRGDRHDDKPYPQHGNGAHG